MKTVFKSSELPHLWANQSINGIRYGRCPGHEHFEDDAYYSYATVIARRIRKGSKVAYILDRAGFSITTSGHLRGVSAAIPEGEKVFSVREGMHGQSLRLTPTTLRDYYVKKYKRLGEAKPSRYARIRAENLTHRVNQLETAVEVATFFGIPHKSIDNMIAAIKGDWNQALETIVQQHKRTQDAEKRREAKQFAERQAQAICYANNLLNNDPDTIARYESINLAAWEKCLAHVPELLAKVKTKLGALNSEKINAWLRGESVRLPNCAPTMLRAEENEMVTSMGARVPLADAMRTCKFAFLMRLNGWHRNGEQHKIGSYQLDAINEFGCIAGCHRVSWHEIERFCVSMGWLNQQPAST